MICRSVTERRTSVLGSTEGEHHPGAGAALRQVMEPALTAALSQSWVLEVESDNRIMENRRFASFNFPVFGSWPSENEAAISGNVATSPEKTTGSSPDII